MSPSPPLAKAKRDRHPFRPAVARAHDEVADAVEDHAAPVDFERLNNVRVNLRRRNMPQQQTKRPARFLVD